MVFLFLDEAMSAVDENPEEAMLRKFFQGILESPVKYWLTEFAAKIIFGTVALCPSAKPHDTVNQDNNECLKSERAERDDHNVSDQTEEEEDPYSLNPEDIYDTVDADSTYSPVILNRPPAPIPRPEPESISDKPMIFRGMTFYVFLFPQSVLFTKQIYNQITQ